MRKSNRAAAAVMSVVLAAGLCPAAAFAAQDDALVATQGIDLTAQAAETMTSTWLQANGTTSKGSTRSFSPDVQVEAVDGGYQLDVTFTSVAAIGGALDKFQYQGTDATIVSQTDSQIVYRVVVPSIDWAVPITYGYTVSFGGQTRAMSHDVYLLVASDADALAQKQEAVSKLLSIEVNKEYVASVTWSSPKDGHDTTSHMSSATVNNKVGIAKAEDGTYLVTLKPTSALISGFEYPVGTAVAANEDGTTTLSVATPLVGLEIVTNITVPGMGAHPQDQIMTIDPSTVVEGSIADEEQVVDKTALTKVIEEALAIEQGKKTDEAYQVLQDAIAAAQAVVDNQSATADAVHAAVQALKNAVEAFNTSAEDAGLTTGKTYTAPAKYLKADSDEESMAGAMLDSQVKIYAADTGSYLVYVSTSNETALEQNMKVYYADGSEADDCSADGMLSFALSVNNLSEPITIQFSADAMPVKQSARLVIDMESIAEKTVSMFRLYNPNSGEHFYTASETERADVIAAGWTDEGVGWIAPENGYGKPVYRLYNKYGGEHHYTMDAAEKENLIALGWNDEGIGWYSDAESRVEILREYNPNAFANNHNYTPDAAEHKNLIALGWNDEGIAWYGAAEVDRSQA